MEERTLESLVSLTIMKIAIVLRSGIRRIILLQFQMLNPELTLDGFEDILDWELQ